MLSPSIRQVFHALLTRPPLTYNSLGFVISPFDLHVLGTPPAFILSQDQTLMFFRSLLPVPSGFRQSLSGFYRLFLSVLLFLWVDLLQICSLKSLFGLPASRLLFSAFCGSPFLEFSGLHYCLFVKVLRLPVSLPPCCRSQRQL